MVMRIKRYEGEERELPRIIKKIKRDLGENAVMKTRRYKKGGLLGVGGKSMVEVYAGVERDIAAEARGILASQAAINSELLDKLLPKNPDNSTNPGTAHSTISPRTQDPVIYQPPGQSPIISAAPSAVQTEQPGRLENEIHRLALEIADIKKSIVEGIEVKGDRKTDEDLSRFPRWLGHLREKLMANEVREDIIDRMLEETLKESEPDAIADFEGALSAFQRTIMASVEARGNLKGQQSPRVLALAGPTGVGKTTTLAKLAATANLLDKQRVALISADTYRIAAIDQLKTFAGILDIPLKVVFSPAEFREALKEYNGMDRIFIDTAGRSPKNDERMAELRELVSAHEDVECHLVISATTRPRDMDLICDRFKQANYSRFIFTKIDETSTLGPVLNLMYGEGLPASYLTNGQSVPDDIILGEESDLLSLVLRRSMS